jgi:hypothetical protein
VERRRLVPEPGLHRAAVEPHDQWEQAAIRRYETERLEPVFNNTTRQRRDELDWLRLLDNNTIIEEFVLLGQELGFIWGRLLGSYFRWARGDTLPLTGGGSWFKRLTKVDQDESRYDTR